MYVYIHIYKYLFTYMNIVNSYIHAHIRTKYMFKTDHS
jgi:hypothetical protein